MNLMRVRTQSYYRFEGSGCDLLDTSAPLIVNCTGVSVFETPFRAGMPQGRSDYYLMFLACGQLEVETGGIAFTLKAGDAFIYPPEQGYGYRLTENEKMVYLWAHFTGAEAENLLEECGLQPNIVYHAEPEAMAETFEGIQRLFITKPALYQLEAAARLTVLLARLGRVSRREESAVPPERLQTSLQYLNRHYAEPIAMEQLANMEFLSVSRYAALFKQAMGRSPQQYLINLRLHNARGMLLETDLGIGEIARSVGYDDPLYFSRLFHRYFGTSPREYREGRKG